MGQVDVGQDYWEPATGVEGLTFYISWTDGQRNASARVESDLFDITLC